MGDEREFPGGLPLKQISALRVVATTTTSVSKSYTNDAHGSVCTCLSPLFVLVFPFTLSLVSLTTLPPSH